MTTESIQKYAHVLVEAVNVQKGQSLLVKGEPVHWPLINAIAEEAYQRGARYVQVHSNHAALYSARVRYSEPEYLDQVPNTYKTDLSTYMEEGWALISIKNPEDPDFLATLDSARHARTNKALRVVEYPWRQRMQADHFQWLVCAFPTPAWAAKVLGTQATAAASDRLWDIMQPILFLDSADPAAQWRRFGETLAGRAARLGELNLRELRFTGAGTDLRVGLTKRALWVGGGAETPAGVKFHPNLPTYEVFTTPDFRATEGIARASRPGLVMDQVVEEPWFRFEKGGVVEWGARSGLEALDRYFEADSNNRYLGEVALVDSTSPIFTSGNVFYNILFDENAACHVALGSAYPGCLTGGNDLTPQQLREAGANVSTYHTDFMIGSPEVEVTGTTVDGAEVGIISEGRFVI